MVLSAAVALLLAVVLEVFEIAAEVEIALLALYVVIDRINHCNRHETVYLHYDLLGFGHIDYYLYLLPEYRGHHYYRYQKLLLWDHHRNLTFLPY